MKIPNFSADVPRRSDRDLLEIVKMTVKKYDMMGAIPILPVTEDELRRIKDLMELGIEYDSTGEDDGSG